MAELKRGDVIRDKILGLTGIFYSYYRPKENHDMIYILLPMYDMPQITSISTYEATGEHVDIFEKIKQGDPAPENERVRRAQDLMNSLRDLFWNDNNKEN